MPAGQCPTYIVLGPILFGGGYCYLNTVIDLLDALTPAVCLGVFTPSSTPFQEGPAMLRILT